MLELPLFGPIRHMKRIGQLEEHQALRARNEARLAALKASNRLYEDKRESTPRRNQPVIPYIGGPYVPGAALSNILGFDLFGTGR